MKKALFTLLMFTSLVSFGQFSNLNMAEGLKKINQRSIVIDVRTPAEFVEGHLPGAINIDWFSTDFNASLERIGKRKKIYVYCRSGKRSAKAAARLDSLGFKRVTNLKGGYKAYLEN